MIRRPPRSTRTDTLFPYTTLFRSKLINEFGDLESVLAAAPMMKKSKMQENLLAHSEMARLSRKLVDLHCEVPLPQPLETLALEGIPADPLKAFLEHHGFNSLRSEERRVGKECVSRFRSRWSPEL